mgnify:CR=1 FL=1
MKVGDLVRLKYAKYTDRIAIVIKYNSWSGDCKIMFVDTGRIWQASEPALTIIE